MSSEDYAVHRKSIGSLFDEAKVYKIPSYQRSYSWDADNAGRLLEDLIDTANADSGSNNSTNLLGAMVVVPETGGFEVVDGQQRLATTALILCAMRSHLYKFRGKELPGTHRDLNHAIETIDDILNASPGKPRIELGKDDYELFKDILSTDTPDHKSRCKELQDIYQNGKKRKLRSHERLIKNYRELSGLVKERIESFGKLDDAFDNRKSDEFSEVALGLSKYVSQKMVKRSHFAFIEVKNRDSAYKIFTTFNSAGQKLMKADLVKSHLLGKVESGTDSEMIEERWRKIFDERLKDHDRFLYESTSSRYPSGQCNGIPITTENLYRIAGSVVKHASHVDEYVRRLEKDAKIVKQMDRPEDLPEDDKYEKTQSIFYRMQLLNARYIRVPMLAAGRKWRSLGSAEFQTLADCLLTFFFKFKFINDGTAEDVRAIANKVTDKIENGADLSEIIYLILINKNVSGPPRRRIEENRFKAEFQGKMFKLSTNAAKYILSSMEIYLNRRDPHPYPKPTVELEHILPENHEKCWDKDAFLDEDSPDNIDEYKNRLGNLTLLYRKWNRGIGAKCFLEKLKDPKGYESSKIKLNEEYLNSYDKWTATTLKEREEKLCELALEAWSLSQYDEYLVKQGYRDQE